ncbi:AMP-binding protein [Flavobacteriaceae bacterium F89]|uniref:AMP-binding protein n=1 Tax=Cerina litoralis TaxID=2874477 RepID=A0AAE3JPL4_9FLAO|nr:AMP-binding protein [Cerina litoralis]MCG2459253.1 AMP-binding protein [Cerina litoralis]
MKKFNSSLEAFIYWEKEAPNNLFLNQLFEKNNKPLSYAEAGIEIRKIASYLLKLGLPKKSHVAILSKNCSHWILADLAISMAGFISIPIYPTLMAKGVGQILTHSEAKAIFIGKLDDFDSQKEGIPDIPVISVKTFGGIAGTLWEDIIERESGLMDFTMPKRDDLYTIIYTSGTTGQPKGAMHTVGNFSNAATAFNQAIPLPGNPKFLSYLPLAHVAERAFCSGILFFGGQITFAHSLESFAKNLESVQPDVFFAVPRIWTKIQESILENLPQRKLSMLLAIPIVNTLVKKKINTKLGLANATFICSGAAPIAPNLVNWYANLGITILQGYGMTEDCCVSHTNLKSANKIGTVGKALADVSIKLSVDNEICIKNKCLFKGYYKAPDITTRVFDKEGYFKTGDIGEYDKEGFLTITGRVKDQFKTDKGKYISPSPLELQFSKNTDIEQICIVGTGLPQPIALITASAIGKAKKREELVASLSNFIQTLNPTLKKHEKIEKVVVLQNDWTVENGMTTPTLKIKRNRIEKNYRPLYKSWYELEQKVVFES